MEWYEELQGTISFYKGNSAAAEVYRMCLACATYQIWKEKEYRDLSTEAEEYRSSDQADCTRSACSRCNTTESKQKLDSLNFYP